MDSEQTGMEITTAGTGLPARTDDANDVMELIRFALTEDVGVEKLERLMALKERHEAKEARRLYLDALTAFQAECPEIPKTKGVSFDDRPGARVAYFYAPLEVITRIIDPILRRHGLSYSWTTAGVENGSLNVVCTLRHVGGHEEQVPFPTPTATKGKMSPAQMNGAALTYGRRQSLIAVLGLTTTDDDMDGREPRGRGEDAKTVTAEQAAALDDLADEAGANKRAFCQHLGIASLADLPASRFEEARALLNQKLDKKRGGT